MDLQNLIQYIEHFIQQQHCFRHVNKRAKLIRFSTNINETYICSECVEIDNSSQQLLSISCAADRIRNFILYGEKQSDLKLSTISVLNTIRQQLTTFYNSFTKLLENIESKLRLRNESQEKHETMYQKKLNEIQRCVANYTKVQTLSTIDVHRQKEEQHFTGALNYNLMNLLQNEILLSTCNYEIQTRINEIFQNSTSLMTNLVDEQSLQLKSLIEQEDYLLTLISDYVDPKMKTNAGQTKSNFELYNTSRSHVFKSMIQSYSSAIGAQNNNWHIRSENHHATFSLVSPNRINVPFSHSDKPNLNLLRLALISPIIQDGPLKQPRSITFQIHQQIRQSFAIGICKLSPSNFELEIVNETHPFVFFTAQGTVINRELQTNNSVMASPIFSRGDQISLILKPQTNFIQVVKNKMYNQPFQYELMDPKSWKWMNLCFAIAVQGVGGGEIEIMNRE